ncbi:MAG: hypothetical protein IJM15_04540 [Erysipelotrichaceae bacterium]|nr:hypothetical protein [Erysipelotrichaceae bacterium]
MFRHSEISTEVDRGPFIFTSAAFAGSILIILVILKLGKGNTLGYVSAALFGVVALASLAVLVGLLCDYAYIKDGVLYTHYILKGNQIALKDIGKLTLKDDVYTVYDKKGYTAGTINGLATGIDLILHELDRNGIRVS